MIVAGTPFDPPYKRYSINGYSIKDNGNTIMVSLQFTTPSLYRWSTCQSIDTLMCCTAAVCKVHSTVASRLDCHFMNNVRLRDLETYSNYEFQISYRIQPNLKNQLINRKDSSC